MGDERRLEVIAARESILYHLKSDWPDSVDIELSVAVPSASVASFLEACTTLQNDGLIMYEALLLGVGPSPKLLAAALTRKGQQAVSGRSIRR